MNLNIKKAFKIIVSTVLSISAVFYLSVYIFDVERKIVYNPEKQYQPVLPEISQKAEIKTFKNSDGLKLTYLHIKGDKKSPTILYCHGNSENISFFQKRIKFLTNKNYEVFMLDYRGYGQSEGQPSEKGLYKDLDEMINHLNQAYKIDRKKLILWGHSLGGAVAADTASRKKFKGVILEGTFTKLTDMKNYAAKFQSSGREEALLRTFVYNSIPVTQKFETIDKVNKISSPLLFAHSKQDKIVPVEMSIQLHKNKPDAELFLSKYGSHDGLNWNNKAILDFIDSLK